jgi:hypothetical protein
MTDERLAEIEARLAAVREQPPANLRFIEWVPVGGQEHVTPAMDLFQHAPQDLADLLAEVRRYRALLGQYYHLVTWPREEAP